MKKLTLFILAAVCGILASCQKDPDTDKLDNNYLVGRGVSQLGVGILYIRLASSIRFIRLGKPDNLSLIGAILTLCEAHLREITLLLNLIDANNFVGITLCKNRCREQHCERKNTQSEKLSHSIKYICFAEQI